MAKCYPNTYNIAYFLMDRPTFDKEFHTGFPLDLGTPEKVLTADVKQSRYPEEEQEPIEKVTL